MGVKWKDWNGSDPNSNGFDKNGPTIHLQSIENS